MKTIVFTAENELEIQNYKMNDLPNHLIMIKIEACAICTWEQRAYTGVKKVDYPYIGGHEIAAEIVKVGSDVSSEWQIGDKVIYGTQLACGDCHFCKIGEEQSCTNFVHTKQMRGLPHPGMGGLSQYMIVEPRRLFRYKNVSPLQASLTEPLSCVIHSINSADIQLGDFVLVVGCGIMGMFHVLLAQKKGATVIASDMNEERLALAKELGATYVINPQKEDQVKKVMELTDDLGADVIFDTTPIAKVVKGLIPCLSNLGKLVLYSSFYPDTPVGLSMDSLHKKAQKIIGTANSNSKDYTIASRLISNGVIDVEPFINEVYPFDQAKAAFESAIKADKYRVVIDFTK